MDYPQDFSPQALARVEAERLKAGKQLEQRRNQVPWSRYGPVRADEENLRKYILRVFLVFAQEACKLGSQRQWAVDRIRSEVGEFLRRFTIEAHSDKGYDKQGRKLREMICDGSWGIRPEVQREFEKSAEWKQFEQELLAVAEQQARGSPQSSGAGAAAWDTIEISFLSDERVQIRNGTDSKTYNYAELGFEDSRSGKQNQAWVTLRDLAEGNGRILLAARSPTVWPKVEKRIQEIRKALRNHFGIYSDPFLFEEGIGYQARFKIGFSPSFHT